LDFLPMALPACFLPLLAPSTLKFTADGAA
jgi:hypothetical protein